jgi:hypothetical protein
LILTTEFCEPIAPLTAVQFGDTVGTFLVPPIDSSESTKQEYIFVLDCSGSMKGHRIEQAKECLKLFLHSLPADGYFNIVCFGSHCNSLWQSSRAVIDENVRSAGSYVADRWAVLGGTKITKPLAWILKTPAQFPKKKRQLFILTDGEDFYPDQVMRLVMERAEDIRCSTIGLGRGADPGLVKEIASRTNGCYDFVYSGVDLRSKVIPQLEAAMSVPIENVGVNVLGASPCFCTQDPIQPLVPENLSTVFIQCHGLRPGGKVLVTGMRQGTQPRYLSPSVVTCDDDLMITVVAKYIDSLRLIKLEQEISKARGDPEILDELVNQAIEMSTRSGILCPYTAFVAFDDGPLRVVSNALNYPILVQGASLCSEVLVCGDMTIKDLKIFLRMKYGIPTAHQRILFSGRGLHNSCTLNACAIRPRSIVYIIHPLLGGGPTRGMTAESEPPHRAREISALLEGHSVDGSWLDLHAMLAKAGLRRIPDLPNVRGPLPPKVAATVLALALLKKHHSDQPELWRLLEVKAMQWLSGARPGMPWSQIVDSLVALLP